MKLVGVLLCLGLTAAAGASSLKEACLNENSLLHCLMYAAQQRSTVQLSEDVTIEKVRGGRSDSENGEEEGGFLSWLDQYAADHEIKMALPGGSRVSLTPRALQLDLDTEENQVQGKSRRKNKLRKLVVPLLVLGLLKAMTLIPMLLGVLGLKAWNALQLSFFAFVSSLALAIFQLCKKVASDGAVPVAHTSWDPYHYAARNLLLSPEQDLQLPYSAYQQ